MNSPVDYTTNARGLAACCLTKCAGEERWNEVQEPLVQVQRQVRTAGSRRSSPT